MLTIIDNPIKAIMTLNEGCYKVSNNHYHLLEVHIQRFLVSHECICQSIYAQIKNGVYTITNMYDQKFEMDVSYGDFGEAPEAVKEATGKNRLDIRLKTIWTEDMGEGLRELVMIHCHWKLQYCKSLSL